MSKQSGLKQQLHANNLHNQGYDFEQLCEKYPPLNSFVTINSYHNKSIDFSNADAVKALNCALLAMYYRIEHWDIPDGYLCPPIPGRVDYIHYLHDLLSESFKDIKGSDDQQINCKKNIQILDIGTGASCIYPILGQRCYQWQFIASDIDPTSINVASQIVLANKGLKNNIKCRLQSNANHFFKDILLDDEYLDATICNPPFHQSLEQASAGTSRKWKNLGKVKTAKASLNFGGQKAELWCPGGELTFISNMIVESKQYKNQVLWFTSLVSKSVNLAALTKQLQSVAASQVKIIEMRQGQKISRFIAWSYLSLEQQQIWIKQRHG